MTGGEIAFIFRKTICRDTARYPIAAVSPFQRLNVNIASGRFLFQFEYATQTRPPRACSDLSVSRFEISDAYKKRPFSGKRADIRAHKPPDVQVYWSMPDRTDTYPVRQRLFRLCVFACFVRTEKNSLHCREPRALREGIILSGEAFSGDFARG